MNIVWFRYADYHIVSSRLISAYFYNSGLLINYTYSHEPV